jgi:hypothetical protein
MSIKGLTAWIFRANHGDFSNGGPSGKYDEVLVVDDEVGGPAELDSYRQFPVRLVRREIRGEEYVHAVPLLCEEFPGFERFSGHTMFGGTFIYTSDSRLRDACAYPIPLHDRVE